MRDLKLPIYIDDGYFSARLGYRYQQNKFLFKVGFTPFFMGGFSVSKRGFYIAPFGGLAVGYSF